MIGPKRFTKKEMRQISLRAGAMEEEVIRMLNEDAMRLCREIDDFTLYARRKVEGLIRYQGLSSLVRIIDEERKFSHYNDHLRFKVLKWDFERIGDALSAEISSETWDKIEHIYSQREEYLSGMTTLLADCFELNEKEEMVYERYLDEFTMVTPLGGDAAGLQDRAILYAPSLFEKLVYRAEANLSPIPEEDLLGDPKAVMHSYTPGRMSNFRMKRMAAKEDALVYLVTHPDKNLRVVEVIMHVAEKMRTARLKELDDRGELAGYFAGQYPEPPDYVVSESNGQVFGVNVNGSVSFRMQQELLRRSSEMDDDKLLQ